MNHVTKIITFSLVERSDTFKGYPGRWALFAEYNSDSWSLREWGSKPASKTIEKCVGDCLRDFEFTFPETVHLRAVMEGT